MYLCLVALLSLVGAVAADEKDITQTYVQNASFEADAVAGLAEVTNAADGRRGWTLAHPSGWTVSGTAVTQLLVKADCYADNNFGQVTTVADGEAAYYLRQGWATGSTKVAQTLKNLPAGKYKLTIDHRTGYANSATSSLTLSAGTMAVTESFVQGSAGFFATAPWKTTEVVFSTASVGDVEIAVKADWLSGGSCVMMDNVRLYELPDDYVEPEQPDETDVESPTEGVITHDFVPEAQMKDDLLQMLANFSRWMKNDFQPCEAPNSIGEVCGCFRGENTMANDERGVRPNADLSMICAFLVKYAKDKVTLPEGVTWTEVEDMAMQSLVFAYSTHKANRLKVCKGNNYWGSTSRNDYTWESSLWAMSVAYSAYFQWDKLTDEQKGYIYALLKAECNYELERSIPTGYVSDSKAEENGWEADVLAAALGLFPNDALAPKWFARLREFAINSYSHYADATDKTIIDPEYDNTTVADLYKGKNLYDDFTLQNHNLFHTSYQNVVMQELGEAALALKMFQLGTTGVEKWRTNALMHNNQEVMDEVLNWLALADGELAMPNGNDWSLFLFDQITSYSTMACFLRDPNALMLENMAYKYIKARQQTTADGSWLLNADVGARRMGVEAHRVMMTWLMHETLSTADLTATVWSDFNARYADAKIFGTQNIVRAATEDRFTCFSWSTGLKSYTGYVAANSPDKNKIIVPYRANNTGNFLGWYTVSGKGTNATPVVSGIYDLRGNSYTMNGELNTNDATLNNRFAIYSTPGNAVIYLDYVRGNAAGTITREQGGLMAISVDPMMKEKRTVYVASPNPSQGGGLAKSTETSAMPESPLLGRGKGEAVVVQLDGSSLTTWQTPWVNVDNELGIVSKSARSMAFGDRSLNNSIHTAKLYPSYSAESRSFSAGEVVDRRHIIYYSNMDAATTQAMSEGLQVLTDRVPEGWNGVIAPDPDGAHYLLLSNFVSDRKCTLAEVTCPLGAPVFSTLTSIADSKSTAEFVAEINHSVSETLRVFVKGDGLTAVQAPADSCVAYLAATGKQSAEVTVSIVCGDTMATGTFTFSGSVKVSAEGTTLSVEEASFPEDDTVNFNEGYTDITAEMLTNANFEDDVTYGNAGGNVTLGSTVYNPCYVNAVKAKDSQYPNILPVEGWTPKASLSGGSNFARMYSMPYSTTMYCVSPSNVGNYAAQCARPLMDDTCGVRCLTVLNSWTSGTNRIVQTVTLPAGDYRLLIDMRYECTNQQSNDGRRVVASGNTNTSYTGIKYAGTTDYRYPTENASWELMPYDFTLTERGEVEISLGFATSASVGAANNTLLYIDNVRLLKKNTNVEDVIDAPQQAALVDVYSLQGVRLRSAMPVSVALHGLQSGVYIVGGEKVAIQPSSR
ncbi:MAG: hypothetical protein J6V12_04665 [Bacteroidaceae bacterium]|nr:hypothetical protein [Bacteroidaceae bacterium]